MRQIQCMRCLIPVVGLVFLVSCTAYRMGNTLNEYQGQVLRVTDDGPGAPRLELEKKYDPALRHYVEQHGSPDYIYVESLRAIQLMFVEDDRIIRFQRSRFNPKSRAVVTEGISGPLSSLFSREDQERLAESRARRVRRSSDMAPQSRP